MIAGWSQLRSWTSWQKARQEGESLGLEPIITRLEDGGNSLDVPALFERSFRRALLFAIIESEQALRDFFGPEHQERIERFRKLDDKLGELAREVIRARLAARIPREQACAHERSEEDEVPMAELGFLRKEIGKKTGRMAVRQLLSRIPQLLPRLKPCVLMSPLSVAQYLEASHKGFDVVIFDEASQIPVWDSVGAIARGTQLIVVGDPKQLPPTNFFSPSDEGDDETIVEQEDLESILDELLPAMALPQPARRPDRFQQSSLLRERSAHLSLAADRSRRGALRSFAGGALRQRKNPDQSGRGSRVGDGTRPAIARAGRAPKFRRRHLQPGPTGIDRESAR
jgi:hypothetical protein